MNATAEQSQRFLQVDLSTESATGQVGTKGPTLCRQTVLCDLPLHVRPYAVP